MKFQLLFDLFKIFFPSWEFFDKSDDILKIYYIIKDKNQNKHQVTNENNTKIEWIEINIKKDRKLHKLFHNPETNIALNIESQVELFVESIYNIDELTNSNKSKNYNLFKREFEMFYKIIQNFVNMYIIESDANCDYFKFKITAYNIGKMIENEIFISDFFKVRL